MGWWSRLRHRRGFGVHSPFAFRLVKDCLCERTRYYDYALLPKSQWLLYRLAAWLQPSQITALGSADARAAIMACPPKNRRKASPWTGLERVTLAVADANGGVGEAVAAISQGTAVYITNCSEADRAALRAAINAAAHGQTFANRSGTLIALPFPGLTPQHFDVSFA